MSEARAPAGGKSFGSGRIVLWRGGSVWIGHAAQETGFHEHHAIQATLALSGGTVRLRRPAEDWTSHAAAIVAAHQPHAFEARGEMVALVFTEPESREGRMLGQRYPEGVAALDAGALADEAANLAAAYAHKAADEELAACARAVTAKLASLQALPIGSEYLQIDKRIERAIDLLRERLGEPVTMAGIADAVHLSPERFRHLFLEQTGIRFRPYVLWLRLEIAIAAYAAGHSLTHASHAGGFADSAHFSRTFKRMFGVPAAGIQRD